MRPSNIIRDRHKYMQSEELDALQEVISTLPENSICVNIGAGFGTSGLAFIESDNVGILFTVDKYRLDSENGLGSLEFEERVFKEFGYTTSLRYRQICGDSAEIGLCWKSLMDEKVDMCHIDADHSYEHCKADIVTWLPNIKAGGIISFHDYGPEDGLGGVTSAVDELVTGKYPKIAHAKAFAAFRIV